MKKNDVSFKYSITAGTLKKGEIKRNIEEFCFLNNIKVSLKENNGLLESVLLYEFSGPKEEISKLKINLRQSFFPYQFKFTLDKSKQILSDYGDILENNTESQMIYDLVGLRPESQLVNSKDDIKESIRHVILLLDDIPQMEPLFEAYQKLADFIPDDDYKRVDDYLSVKSESSEDHKKHLESWFEKIFSNSKKEKEEIYIELKAFLDKYQV